MSAANDTRTAFIAYMTAIRGRIPCPGVGKLLSALGIGLALFQERILGGTSQRLFIFAHSLSFSFRSCMNLGQHQTRGE
jgi:hypothetical protein